MFPPEIIVHQDNEHELIERYRNGSLLDINSVKSHAVISAIDMFLQK